MDDEMQADDEEQMPKKRVPTFLPNEVFNASKVFRDIGKFAMQNKNYEQALKKLELVELLTKNPVELAQAQNLMSECYLEMCDVPNARACCDKAKALADHLFFDYSHARVLYAENLFENALVVFEHGSRQRTFPDLFCNGVNIATGTVENCVGINAGPMLGQDHLGKLITEMKLIELDLIHPQKKVLTEEQKKKESDLMEERKKQYSEKYLGIIARERQVLNEMLQLPALFGEKPEHNKIMEETIRKTIEKLDIIQDSLWRRKPLYCFEHMRGKPAPNQIREAKAEMKLKKKLLLVEVERQLSTLLKLYDEKNWNTLYRRAEHLRNKVWNLSEQQFPTKREFIIKIIDIIGNMYLAMKSFLPQWKSDWNDKRLVVILGLKRPPSSVSAVSKDGFHAPVNSVQKKMDELLELIRLTQCPYQQLYYNYEVSCLYAIMGNYLQARSYSRYSIYSSRKEGNVVWYINSLFLFARSQIQDNNHSDALVTLTAVREACSRFGFTEQEEFIDRALTILYSEPKVKAVPQQLRGTYQREQSIIDLMPNLDLKSHARTLIYQMNQKPNWKRMPLLKGAQGMLAMEKKGMKNMEVAKEEEKRRQAREAAKEVKQAMAEAAEALAASRRPDFTFIRPIQGVDPDTMRSVVDRFRRRSTFNLERFEF